MYLDDLRPGLGLKIPTRPALDLKIPDLANSVDVVSGFPCWNLIVGGSALTGHGGRRVDLSPPIPDTLECHAHSGECLGRSQGVPKAKEFKKMRY